MARVQDLLHIAEQDLRIIGKSDGISEASDLLSTSRNRMIVVCAEDSTVSGVVTRGDVLRGIHRENATPSTRCDAVMSKQVKACTAKDSLDDVWSKMSTHNLNAMPIVDDAGKPVGVLSSKCVLVKLLSEARQQDKLMREYIDGMGYR